MNHKEVMLGTEGIAELMRYFSSMQETIDDVIKESEKRLADRGRDELEATAPTQSIDGNNPGTISVQKDADAIRVVYAGDDVAYIEFGTGYVGQNNPYPDEIALNNAQWAYDINEHGYGGWVYRKKDGSGFRHSRGMTPEAPVLKAFKKTKEAVPQIVKEVMDEKFGD